MTNKLSEQESDGAYVRPSCQTRAWISDEITGSVEGRDRLGLCYSIEGGDRLGLCYSIGGGEGRGLCCGIG